MVEHNQSGIFWSTIARENCWSTTEKCAYFAMVCHPKSLLKFMLWSTTGHYVLMKNIERGSYNIFKKKSKLWYLGVWVALQKPKALWPTTRIEQTGGMVYAINFFCTFEIFLYSKRGCTMINVVMTNL